jgi:hypothetical protein
VRPTHLALAVVAVGASVAVTACGSSSSSSSSASSTAATSAASTATSGSSSTTTTGASTGGATSTSTCPSAAQVSAALGSSFTLTKKLSVDSSSIECSYSASGGGGVLLTYSVAPSGSESAVRARLTALAGGLGNGGGKPVSGVGDAAYAGSTSFGSVDAKAIYAIKGTKTVLLVASAPLTKVEAYASSLLG